MWLATFILVAFAAHRATAQYLPILVDNLNDQGSRIVSGWESQPGQHPHQVSLRVVRKDGVVSGCGGNVVHREWVLTAAHCTATQVTIVVRAGIVHMTRPEMMLETTEYYTHPTYDISKVGEIQHDDIALIKLQRPLVYSKNLQAIRVQPSSDAFRDYDGEILYASGFGRTWTTEPHSDHLKWVYLRAISNAECVSVYTTAFVGDTTICAKSFNVSSQSTCFGDDGGPLVHLSPEGVPTLVGVSSFVMGLPDGCHSGLPAGFIRPGPFHEWLTEISGIDFNNLNEEDESTIDPTTFSAPVSSVPSTQPTTNPDPNPTTIANPVPTTIPTAQSTTIPSSSPTITSSTQSTTIHIPSPTTVLSHDPTTISNPSTTTTSSTHLPTIPSIIPTTIPSTDLTTTPSPTTTTTTTTVAPPTTTTEEPYSDENDLEDDDDDDNEISNLLKNFEVKVNVKVKLNKYLKKRIEKSVD